MAQTDQIGALVASVEERQEDLVNLLCDLVRFETAAPPARNTTPAQDYIQAKLSELNFSIDRWEMYPGDPVVVGTRTGAQSGTHKSLILNGHMDVAEVHPDEAWETGPFEPLLRDGWLTGRGTADMKGGIACALFALKLLNEAGVDPLGDVIFQSVIGEEVGEAGTQQCIERGYSADFALIMDTSDMEMQGQGGVITGWITVKSQETHHDGTRACMIHAGGGTFGASAIEKMMKIIAGLQDLERHWAVTKHYPGMVPGSNTINPAVIQGGRHPAFIADECKLWITVHFLPNETHTQVIEEIERHLNAVAAADPWLSRNPLAFTWGGTSMIEDQGEIFPSLVVDPDHDAIGVLSQAHHRVTGQVCPVSMSPTVNDGGWFGFSGIPAAIYGPGTLAQAHAVNEKVEVAQLVAYTQVLLRFVYDWTRQPR